MPPEKKTEINFTPDPEPTALPSSFVPDEPEEDTTSIPDSIKDFVALTSPSLALPEWKLHLLKNKRAGATAANALAFGYLPNIVGAVKSRSFSSPEYVKERDSLQKYLDSSSVGNKIVGNTAGGIVGAAVPLGPALKGGSALVNFAKTVGTGALMGGLANPGNVPGKVTPIQPVDRLMNAGKGAALTAALAGGGAAIQGLRQRLAANPAKNVEEVVQIAKGMGIDEKDIPTEMLTTDVIPRDKAAALKRDPSIGGGLVRRKLQPFQDKIQGTAEDFVSDAHAASETGATVGTRVRDQIPAEVEKKLAPARQAYEDLSAPMANAKPDTRAMKVGTGRLRNELAPGDSTGELRRIVEQEKAHFLENIKTVEDLKKYRTDIFNKAKDARAQGNSRTADVYSTLYDVLTRERDRSLERAILNSGRKIGAGARAEQTVEKLRAADKLYGTTVRESLAAVGAESSRNQPPMAALKDHLDSISVDKLPDRLWSGGDSEQAAAFAKQFPAQAEDVRRLALQRIAKASSKGPELSPTALDAQLSRMTPEAANRVLGAKAGQLPTQRTLLKAMPDPNFNPSQTNIRSETLKNWHPMKQVESLAGAAELNLRRPLQFVKQDGALHGLSRSPVKAAVVANSTLNNFKHTPEESVRRVAGTQFEAPLAAAAARGGASFGSTFFLLHQSYPEFRQLMEAEESTN